MEKTAKGLVEYAIAQLGRPYWYGTYGQAASKELYNYLKGKYPSYYKWDYAGEVVKVHDCTGLAEGYLFCDTPEDLTPTYNPDRDRSANETLRYCTEKGDISTIPEIPGVLVFYDCHEGVYIGSGEVIEARGHKYGVVKTKLSARPWENWGKHPDIDYDAADAAPVVKLVSVSLPVLKKGAKSEVVRTMQWLLIRNGYDMDGYGADGSFGGATKRALEKFQADNGLEVDASCGRKTWTKLLGME
jgi:hypothetical protein